jgi:hypothetical protein
MTQNFMMSYEVDNGLLLQLQNKNSFAIFPPYFNINKNFAMNQAEVTATLGYQAQFATAATTSGSTAVFLVLLLLGVASIAFGVVMIVKYINAKKLAEVTSDRV